MFDKALELGDERSDANVCKASSRPKDYILKFIDIIVLKQKLLGEIWRLYLYTCSQAQ